ncbi:MAG: bifunctional riboflavin kinase/FAD synthetase [Duodenibacillus sp.]|nr:bifunctional riboflavin kinase/FAD synthetase [Duodenibacillus sp.]
MQVFRTTRLPAGLAPSAAAIGNFDGVHLGHRALVQMAAAAAAELGAVATAVTFEPHPKELFGAPAPRVTTLREKCRLLELCGAERLVVLPFTRAMAAMSPREFCCDLIARGLGARFVAVGEGFRFAAGNAGDADALRRYGGECGFEACAVPHVMAGEAKVSSSLVREALDRGDLARAQALLGHELCVTGRVIHGAALGRTLGYPTLNLAVLPPGSRARPAVRGVYAVRIHGLCGEPLAGVASLGFKPTVSSERRWLLEAHAFGWSGDAYGRVARVEFVHLLRQEKKFSGLAELKAAIDADAERARAVLGC